MKHGTGMPFEQASEMCRALIELLMPACRPGYCREAGSIRRMKPRPNDIEIVAVPLFKNRPVVRQIGLFAPSLKERWTGQSDEELCLERTNMLDEMCDDLLRQSTLEKRPDKNSHFAWGSRLKRGIFYWKDQHAPIDLFAVIEPAQWGPIYAIRTGPGDFNRLLVTNKRYGGACPLDRKVAGGRVWDISRLSLEPGRQEAAIAMPSAKFVRLAEGVQLPEIATPKESDFFAALGVPLWPPRLRTEKKLRLFLQERALKAHVTGE